MQKPDNTAKTVVAILLIMAAVGFIVFFAIRSGASSGTVDQQVRQMKPGTRGRKL